MFKADGDGFIHPLWSPDGAFVALGVGTSVKVAGLRCITTMHLLLFIHTATTRYTTPTPATDVCEEQDKAILSAEEHLVALYGQLTNPATGCSGKTGIEQAVCECLAQGSGSGNGLTACVADKISAP